MFKTNQQKKIAKKLGLKLDFSGEGVDALLWALREKWQTEMPELTDFSLLTQMLEDAGENYLKVIQTWVEKEKAYHSEVLTILDLFPECADGYGSDYLSRSWPEIPDVVLNWAIRFDSSKIKREGLIKEILEFLPLNKQSASHIAGHFSLILPFIQSKEELKEILTVVFKNLDPSESNFSINLQNFTILDLNINPDWVVYLWDEVKKVQPVLKEGQNLFPLANTPELLEKWQQIWGSEHTISQEELAEVWIRNLSNQSFEEKISMFEKGKELGYEISQEFSDIQGVFDSISHIEMITKNVQASGSEIKNQSCLNQKVTQDAQIQALKEYESTLNYFENLKSFWTHFLTWTGVINQVDEDGWTILHFMSFQHNKAGVEVALLSGANPMIQTPDGVSALALARISRKTKNNMQLPMSDEEEECFIQLTTFLQRSGMDKSLPDSTLLSNRIRL